MASVRVGGDPESYMDPPALGGGGGKSGVGGIIATVLDMLGVGKQVAKAPKGGAAAAPDPVAPTQSALPALVAAESAFTPSQPLPTDWGQKYLDSIKPLKKIDPNTAL